MPAETPSTPQAIIRMDLDVCQRAIEKTYGLDLGNAEAWGHYTRHVVNTWTGAVLMETLRLAAPDVADRLASELAKHWDDGRIIGELVHEWRQHLDAGRPISAAGRYQTIFERALGGQRP